MNVSGTLDNDFSQDGIYFMEASNGPSSSAAIRAQSTGRIVQIGYGYDLLNPSNSAIYIQRVLPDGTLDPTFANNGSVAYDLSPGDDWATNMELLCNDQIVMCGISGNRMLLAKYDANGFPDLTFGVNGYVFGTVDDMNYAQDVAIQPDGKILVTGRKNVGPGGTLPYNVAVARFNANGSPDLSFGTNGRVLTNLGGNNQGTGLVVLPGGEIVVSAMWENGVGTGNYGFALVKYLSDGSLDLSFDGDGIVLTPVSQNPCIPYSIVLQPDGKFVLSGLDNYLGPQNSIIVRYNSDGTLDTNFNGTGIQLLSMSPGNDFIGNLRLQPDGKILAGGTADEDFLLIRLLTNGILDPTFNNGRTDFYNGADFGGSITTFNDVIYVGGTVTGLPNPPNSPQQFGIAAYYNDVVVPNSDCVPLIPAPGALVLDFRDFGTAGIPGMAGAATCSVIGVQSTGKVVGAGYEYQIGENINSAIVLQRILPDGTLDPSFAGNGQISYQLSASTDWITDMTVLCNDQLITCGVLGSPSQLFVAKFDANGNPDVSFGTNGYAYGIAGDMEMVFSLAVQPDGKILVAGRKFTAGGGSPYNAGIVRFNADGTRDTSFGTGGLVITDLGGTGGSNAIRRIAVQPDGKIVVAGFWETAPNSVNYGFVVARYLADGSLDNTFHDLLNNLPLGIVKTVVSPNSAIANGLALQPDGKIVVAGLENYLGAMNSLIVRYNADGSLDPTFGDNGNGINYLNMGVGDDQIDDLTLQPDGKILACGMADNDYLVMRFDNLGIPDATFNNGRTDFYTHEDAASSIKTYHDKIYVGGTAAQSAIPCCGGFIDNIVFGYAEFHNDVNVPHNSEAFTMDVTPNTADVCAGQTVTLTASSAIYYAWSNASTTSTVTVGAGTYTVTGTALTGCLAYATATVNQTPSPTVEISGVLAICPGNTTVLTVNGADTYLWSTGATSASITVGTGTFTVTGTIANGCTGSGTATVTENATPAISISGNTNICAGNTTVLTANGANSYLWSTGATTASITVAAGTYSVTGTDVNGCTGSGSATVIENAAPTVSISGNAIACAGNTTTLTASGANSYLWSTGATTASITVGAGTYSVTGTDANGCTGTASATLVEPTALALSTISSDILCNGGNNGVIDLTVSGGTAPYSYAWSNGATTEDLAGIVAGTYTVTVTDGNGCTATSSATVATPSALALATVVSSIPCVGDNSGSIDLTVSGGTAPYSYAWSNGEITEDLTGLAAGTYTVTVTDGNGCTATGSVTLNQNPAPALTAVITHPTCNQSNGSVDLTATGTQPITYAWSNGATTEDITGLAPNVYEITITDGNGCTASAGAIVVASPDATPPTIVCPAIQALNGQFSVTLPDYSGMATASDDCGTATVAQTSPAPGTIYNISQTVTVTLTATDNSGNTSTCNFDVTVVIAGCNFTASINPSSITVCTGATTTLTASAGAGWAWSNGDTNQSITVGVGTYSVTVDDGAGCSAIASAFVSESSPMTFTGIGDGTCAGESNGSVTITITGGTAPYSYDFGFGGTTNNSITGLAAGTYDCTVTDAIGCAIVAQSVVPTFDSPVASIFGTDATCAGNDGMADLTATGGAGNYSYLWSNGATSEDLAGLAQGAYTVTVTDGNGCTGTASVVIGLAPDVIPPSLVCPGTQTLIGAVSVILPDYSGMGTASDNCGGVTVLQSSPAPGTVYNATQSVTVILTATDGSGNTATCIFNVDITITGGGNPCAPIAGVIFVNDNAAGANNGTSWPDAFTNLQSALAAAVAGDVIWVAEGTYKPGVAVANNFAMKAGVDLYGGFADAGCPDLNARDWVLYPTNLSGDIGVIGDPSDNSRRVVQCKNIGNDVRVDGFIIRDALSNSSGGGIGITADGGVSSPYFVNCVVRENAAIGKGAGCYVYSLNGGTTDPRFRDCQFISNVTTANDGAGLTTLSQNGGTINAWLVDCAFDSNIADQKGGGISNWVNAGGNTTLTIDSSSFSNNTASTNGGGVWSYARSGGNGHVVINACTFTGNNAGNGPAIHSQTLNPGSQLLTEIDGCAFIGNTSAGYGAVCTYGQSNSIATTSINDCSFANNIADNGGGVACVALTGSSTTVNVDRCWFENNSAKGGGIMTNCLNPNSNATTNASNSIFYNNSSPSQGGAVSSASSTSGTAFTSLTNCTFYSNEAVSVGGAVNNNAAASAVSSQVSAVNCIFRENPAFKVKAKSFYTNGLLASTTVTNCLLDSASCAANNTGTGTYSCVASFASNPLFLSPGSGDLHLMSGSPAIDAGTNVGLTWDYDGNTRPVGNGFDIGAYEYQGPRPVGRLTQMESFATAIIFPNPTSGLAEVRFDQPVNGLLEVTAIDGRSIMVKNFQNTSQVTLNLGEHGAGLYLVRIVEENHLTILRLMVSK